MSVQAVRYVMENSRATGGARLVALVLAEHADPDGVCWVGVPLIATEAGLSDRGTQKALRRLETSGEVCIAMKAGGTDRTRADRRPNLYRLIGVSNEVNEVNSSSPRESLRGERCDAYEVNDVTLRGEPQFTRTNYEPTTEPTPCSASASPSAGAGESEAEPRGGDRTGEPSASSSTRASRPTGPARSEQEAFEGDFEEVWTVYPRKKPKAGALRASVATRRRGVPHQTLLTATRHYAAAVEAAGTEARYVKHAATFFGPSEPWSDHLEPPQDAQPDNSWMSLSDRRAAS